MLAKSLVKIAQSRSGRLLAALLGASAIYFFLRHAGFREVGLTLSRAAPIFPVLIILEVLILACSTRALRSLYGHEGAGIPLGAWIRAALVGYAVMGLVPAGRTIAESTRAAILAKSSNGVIAAVAAARMQALVLLANAAISFFAAIATYWVVGFELPTYLVLGNFLITLALGLGILIAGKKSNVGQWVGDRIKPGSTSGAKFDENFAGQKLIPGKALGFEFLGRIVQVLQNGVFVFAVGGKFGVIPAFCSEAIHLVGAAVGDLFPAQLGFTEANYQLSAHALALTPSNALSIALLAHLAQLFWMSVGIGVTAFWNSEAGVRRHIQNVRKSSVLTKI